MSLKRSTHLEGPHPVSVGLLETLNIFSVRADYMNKFREYLEREGLESRDPVTLRVPVRANEDFLGRGLVVPALPDGSDFEEGTNFALDVSNMGRVRIDRATRASSWESGTTGPETTDGSAGHERAVAELPLGLVDWERAYLDLLEYRHLNGMQSMAIPGPDTLKPVIEAAPVVVSADPHVLTPTNWHDREDLQAIVQIVLRRCADKCWQSERQRWEAERMNYREVDEADPNLVLNVDPTVATTPDTRQESHYLVNVPRTEVGLRDEIVELIEQQDKLYEQKLSALPRIHFDRHLYQPLLIQGSDPDVRVSPPPLNESETQFVRDLRDFWQGRGSALYRGTELYLLRNQGRGRGVGFFTEGVGFYPDFILWMISGNQQRVVFVEPHGMLNAKAYEEDEKARLHERLPTLADGIGLRSSVVRKVSLDCFVVSATKYDELRPKYGNGNWTRKEFETRHILFPDEKGEYIETLLAEG